MSNILRIGATTGLAMVGVFLANGAHAERIAAVRGTPANEWERACFHHDWGRVKNTCVGQITRLSVAPRTITGSRQFRATGCDPGLSGGDTTCAAVVTDFKGWVKSASGDFTLTGCLFNPPATAVNLGSALTVGSSDAVVIECLLQEGSGIASYVGTVDY